MTTHLTVDDIQDFHSMIKKYYREETTSGKIDRNKIQSILDKPQRTVMGKEIYVTIYEKAACLLEAFCREHVFADGNKRTALLATVTFLQINGYHIAIPPSIIKYVVKIAKSLDQEPDDIKTLNKNISRWIEKRSSTTHEEHDRKSRRYVIVPSLFVSILPFTIIGIPIFYLILRDWFQWKMHPEYKINFMLSFKFILQMTFPHKTSNPDIP